MLFGLGRFLQLVGMILLPIAMAGNLADRLNLWQMLAIAGAGSLVFYLGWWLQQATRPR